MEKRIIRIVLSAVMLFLGFFLLINSQSNITGAFTGLSSKSTSLMSMFAGIIFVVSSFFMFTTTHYDLEKITLSSAIKKHQPLLRLTEEAVNNQTVERELNHLTKELSKGNFEAGLGHPGHIEGTNISYSRGRNGARLYYHKISGDNYEIVAKSAKGKNQDQVINKLKEIYRH